MMIPNQAITTLASVDETDGSSSSDHSPPLPHTLTTVPEDFSSTSSAASCCPSTSCSCSVDPYGTLLLPCHRQSSDGDNSSSILPPPEYPALRKLCYFKTATRRKLCSPAPHIIFHMDTSSPHFPQDIHPIKGICITVIQSSYFWASVGYLIYSILVLILDLCSTEESNSPYSYSCGGVSIATLGRIQSVAAIFYVFNAVHYIFTWRTDYGYPYCNIIALPEYMNTLSGFFYAASTFRYSEADDECGRDYFCSLYQYILIVELLAGILQVLAAIGWFWSWWQTFPRGILGRGWTFDDPDFSASLITLIASFIYLAYSTNVYMDPSTYDSDTLYIVADIMYFVGAIFYLLAVLRDKGSLWCFPVGGTWDYDTFLFLSRPNSASFYIQHKQYKQALLEDYNKKHFVESSSYPYRRQVASPSSVASSSSAASVASSRNHAHHNYRTSSSQSTRAILSTSSSPVYRGTMYTEPEVHHVSLNNSSNKHRMNRSSHLHHSIPPPLPHAHTIGVSSSYDEGIQQYIDSTRKNKKLEERETGHFSTTSAHRSSRRRSLENAFKSSLSTTDGSISTDRRTSTASEVDGSTGTTVTTPSSSSVVTKNHKNKVVELPTTPESLTTSIRSNYDDKEGIQSVMNGVPKEG